MALFTKKIMALIEADFEKAAGLPPPILSSLDSVKIDIFFF